MKYSNKSIAPPPETTPLHLHLSGPVTIAWPHVR